MALLDIFTKSVVLIFFLQRNIEVELVKQIVESEAMYDENNYMILTV